MAESRARFAVLAEFDTPERLVEAAWQLRASGKWRLDAFTPFPVDGLTEALALGDSIVPAATLAGGVVRAAAGFLLQVATNLDYPLWIGGRSLIAVPAFMMITFELMVLGAVLAAVGAMFLANRLPRLHHPVFDAARFDLSATIVSFSRCWPDGSSDRDAIGKALAALHPRAILDVGEAEGAA